MMNRAYHFFFDNFVTKSVSIIVAVVLWIVVLSSKSINIAKDVPVEVQTSPEVVVANELPDRISFQLKGPQAFRRAVQERNEAPIRINLVGKKPGIVTYSFSHEDVHLPLGMRVDSISPSTIRIHLEPMRYTSVKAKVDLRGEPEKGFRVIKSEIHPPEVQIKGSRAQLSALTELAATPVNINGINKNLKEPLSFELSHLGIALEGPPPTLSVEVEPINPNFRLKNVGIRVMAGYKYKLSDTAVTVFIRATPNDLRSLDHSRVYAEIDLRGQKKGKYTINLKVNAPRSIGVLRVVPDKVEVTLY